MKPATSDAPRFHRHFAYPVAAGMAMLFGAAALAADPIVGFTEPVQTIGLAASETGTLAELHVARGAAVAAGQIVGALDADVLRARRELAQARVDSQAKTNAARIKFERAERNVQTLRQLRDEGHGGKRELELAESELELARTDIEAVEDELRLSQLDLKRIDAELRGRQIVSPINGVVIDVHRDVGEFVATTDPKVVTIADLGALRIRFYPPTALVEPLSTGDQLAVRFLHSGQSVWGTIDFIAPVINADSNTIRVDLLLDNRGGRLRSGRRCELVPDGETLRPQPQMAERTSSGSQPQ